jgi:hypothetical protein
LVEFEIVHSRDGVETVYKRLWSKRFGVSYRVIRSLLVVLFVVALGLRDVPSYLLAAISVVVVIAVMMRMTRDSTIKLALEHFDSLGAPTFRFRVDEVGVTERSSVGQIHLQWTAFAGYLELEDSFLLIRSPAGAGQFVAFPQNQFPDAARSLIMRRLSAVSHGLA